MSEFWPTLSTFLLAIVGGVLSNRADKLISTLSQSRKALYEQQKITLENTVQFVLNSPHEETILRVRTSIRGILTILSISTGVFLSVTNNPARIIAGFLFTLIAIYGYYKANKLQIILDKVNQHKKNAHPEIDLDLYAPKK